MNKAHGNNALRRFEDGKATGRVVLAAYECIAIGIAKNIDEIRRKKNPVDFIKRRIQEFWLNPEIEQFFAAGLRGTVRIQRTIPFGEKWFAA